MKSKKLCNTPTTFCSVIAPQSILLSLLTMASLVFMGCVSVVKPIKIENSQISKASFSCTSSVDCWAFSDGDSNGANHEIRRGFLELKDYAWKRKKGWRNWYKSIGESWSNENFTSLSMLDEKTGWLVIDGKLYQRSPSYSGGGWEFVHSPFSTGSPEQGPVKEVFFVDPQHGWLLSGNGEVAITTDGGHQWMTHSIDLGTSYSSLFFLDPLIGWAVADNTYLLQTQDGGKGWVRVGFVWLPGSITQLHFTDEKHGWLIIEGQTSPSHTDNGGLTWVHPIQEPGRVRSVYFHDQFHGWGIQPGKGIMHTADGGLNWIQQDIADQWHEHPMNIVWKTPVWFLGTIALFITSIFDGLPEEFDSLPLLPIIQN